MIIYNRLRPSETRIPYQIGVRSRSFRIASCGRFDVDITSASAGYTGVATVNTVTVY